MIGPGLIAPRYDHLVPDALGVTLAPGSNPPLGVNMTEHSTIMGVFAMATSPLAAAFKMSSSEVKQAWLDPRIENNNIDSP